MSKGYLDIEIGDVVIVHDEYKHDYDEHCLRVNTIEYDEEYATSSNPDGKIYYGTDLDYWNDEIEDYEGIDYITNIVESNFVSFAESNSV